MTFSLHRRPRRQRRGFTLMEVLLVLAILVILGAMVGVAYTRIQRQSYREAARVQINLIEDGLELYHKDFARFPQNLEELRQRPNGADADRWKGPYLTKDVPMDPWGKAYQYELVDDGYGDGGMTPVLTSLGPDGQPGGDDVSNAVTDNNAAPK